VEGRDAEGDQEVFTQETTLANAAFRIQLFNPGDIENVKNVQSDIKVQPLSKFLGEPAPKVTPVTFVKALTVPEQKKPETFFPILNNLLQFAPTHPTEVALKERVARIGVVEAQPFDLAKFPPEIKAAIEQGVADAWADIAATQKKLDAGEITAGDCYGTREYLKNNYINRVTAIVMAGNAQPKEEVIYPFIAQDADGKAFNGANKYTIRFAGDKLPPAKQFWSITMYDLPGRLLVANPLNRYLLNTPMLPNWVKDEDGGYTFYIQHESPGRDKEANWLPSPKDGFYMVMRLYGPSKEAQDGIWKAPKPVKVN
jgi:hypothetical protein